MKSFRNDGFFDVSTQVLEEVLESGVHRFNIHIDKTSVTGSLSLGIVEKKDFKENEYIGDTETGYSIHSNGSFWNGKKKVKDFPKFYQGDIICIIIDLDKGVMAVSRNSTCQFNDQLKVKKDNVSYLFGVTFHRKQGVSILKVHNKPVKEFKEISVISQNLWNHHIGGHGPNPEKRFSLFAKTCCLKLFRPDVLILQELFLMKKGKLVMGFTGIDATNLLVKKLEIGGYQHFTNIVNTIDNYRFGLNSGLLVFSKYPIYKYAEHEFSASGVKEYVNMKGFIFAFIKIKDLDFLIVDIHLDSSSDPSIRELQLLQFRKELDKILKTYKGRIIVSGDWNICSEKIWDDGDQFRRLSFLMKDFSRVEVEGHSYAQDKCSYDHMFFSDGLKTKVKNLFDFSNEEIIVSDHRGIRCTFEITQKTEKTEKTEKKKVEEEDSGEEEEED